MRQSAAMPGVAASPLGSLGSGPPNWQPGLTPVSWRDESLGSGSLALRRVIFRFLAFFGSAPPRAGGGTQVGGLLLSCPSWTPRTQIVRCPRNRGNFNHSGMDRIIKSSLCDAVHTCLALNALFSRSDG